MNNDSCCAVAEVGTPADAAIAQVEKEMPPAWPCDQALSMRLRGAMQWRDDIENPDMIEGLNYNKHKLHFPELEDLRELQVISRTANMFYLLMGCSRRISVVKNELRAWSTADGDVPAAIN